MFFTNYKVLLLLIVVLAGILRFTFLGSVPLSLYWDETASVFNAYSILETGRDEYGSQLPLLFRSFDDYKMPVMIYLTVLPVALLSLTEFAARFISALSGTLTVLVTVLLVRELLNRTRQQKQHFLLQQKDVIALLSGLLLALSPWHVQLSRAGFEANVALFWIVLGAYLLLKANRRWWMLLLSSLVFVLSLYTYRSAFLFTPFLFFGGLLIFVLFPSWKTEWKKVLAVVLVFLILSFPIGHTLFIKGVDTRAGQVSVFAHSQPQVHKAIEKQLAAGNTVLAKIIYNRRVVYTKEIVSNYFAHFHPSYLFLTGDDNPRHSVSGVGLLYLWELPFLLAGLFFLLKYNRKAGVFVLLWILTAPAAAALSVPSPHALRSEVMLPMPHVLTALGVVELWSRAGRYRVFYALGVGVIVLIFFVQFLVQYYSHNTQKANNEWADGYEQLVREVERREDGYERVIVTGYYWQPYIYFLFHTQYDPKQYQKSGSAAGFGKYLFGGTDWDTNVGREDLATADLTELAAGKKSLVVLSPKEYEAQEQVVEKIGTVANAKGEVKFILGELR